MEIQEMSMQSGVSNELVLESYDVQNVRSAEIDIDDDITVASRRQLDRPLPIYLKFADVEFKVKVMGNASSLSTSSSSSECRHNNLNNNNNNNNNKKKKKKYYKEILKGVRGSVGPGEILALMGPSGSGKTSLLKIIGGRLHDHHVSGSVTYNEMPYTPALKRRIGFVTQDDVLFPQLTVEETLLFAAFLRLPAAADKRDRVEQVIDQLGLHRCRHTRIGGGLIKGISGGERKRASIGHEILVDPSLLLLDEPTSGLDSTSANRLLQILEALAKGGRTIITTIHQPSTRMFHMFDKLLLLSEGHPVYYGQARESNEYFINSLRFVPKIGMNPAEFLLDLATGQVDHITVPDQLFASHQHPDFEKLVIRYLQEKYKLGELEAKEKDESGGAKVELQQGIQLQLQVKKEWRVSWMEQFRIVFKRTFKTRCRDYFDQIRLIQALGVAILLGLLWWKSSTHTEAQLRDQIGLLFYICIFWTSSSIFAAVYVFPFEKILLVKERKADMYRLSVYYACSTLCDMLAHLLYPTFFMTILYFMAGFKRTAECFFLTLSVILLIVITSQGAGELSGAAVMSIKRAGMVASMILMLFLLTGGYYVQHIPKFMQWLKYLSFMYYGFRLLMKVHYTGDELYECESKGGCRRLQTSPSFDTINLNGGMTEVWVLLAMAVAFRLCAYLCLRRKISSYQL